jgi:hypothetical protein
MVKDEGCLGCRPLSLIGVCGVGSYGAIVALESDSPIKQRFGSSDGRNRGKNGEGGQERRLCRRPATFVIRATAIRQEKGRQPAYERGKAGALLFNRLWIGHDGQYRYKVLL